MTKPTQPAPSAIDADNATATTKLDAQELRKLIVATVLTVDDEQGEAAPAAGGDDGDPAR
jgi:hypothetical protein